MSQNKECNLHNHIEKLFGPELELDTKLVVAISTHTKQLGKVTTRRANVVISDELNLVGTPSDICDDRNILVVSGLGRTGKDGAVELQLSSLICRKDMPDVFEAPVTVIVTPRIHGPVFATARATVINNDRDVKIDVETWNASGAPAPNETFNWNCRAPINFVID